MLYSGHVDSKTCKFILFLTKWYLSDFIYNITVHLSYETRTQEIFCQHILDFNWHHRQGVIPKSALLERQISTTYANPYMSFNYYMETNMVNYYCVHHRIISYTTTTIQFNLCLLLDAHGPTLYQFQQSKALLWKRAYYKVK